MKRIIYILLICFSAISAQDKSGFQIARLKYNGGGDWYNDPSAEENLLDFVGTNTTIDVNPEYVFVDISTQDLFSYPMLFITGHGNIVLSDADADKLRDYCERGGFIYVDDDYGIDKSFRRAVKKIFPGKEIVELPFNNPLYHNVYDFPAGPPKIHEHDNKPPQGFGIYIDERLVLYYTYESNPSDGWADQRVHNDPEETRQEALRFGTNLIVFVLTQ